MKRFFSLLKGCLFSMALGLATVTPAYAKELMPPGMFDEQAVKRIESAIDAFFKISESESMVIKPLTGGYSATSVLIEFNNKRYVLRMHKLTESKEKIQKELHAMQQAAALGLAPQIYWVSADSKELLMEYVPGGTLTVAEAKRQANIKALAMAFRKIHAAEKNPYACGDFESMMQNFYREIPKDASNAEVLEAALDIIQSGSQELKALSTQRVNIHNDLNPRNIFIHQGNVYFIDWSEALYEEPLHDLAYFSLLLSYNENEEGLLLHSYLQYRPTKEEKKRFAIAKRMNLARLVLGAHYVLGQLKDKSDDTIDFSLKPSSWSFYAESFANNNMPLSKQFFYGMSQAALQYAKSIQVP